MVERSCAPLQSGFVDSKQKGKLARYMANVIAIAGRMDFAKKELDETLLKDIENKKKARDRR